MLVKVRIKNFKSFDDFSELSMISSSKIRELSDHKVKIKQTSILKNFVIYGANASGKSNLIHAVNFFKFVVEKGLPLDCQNMFCRNKEENEKLESEFELQFTVGDKFYAYGFSAILSKRSITAEWLYELLQNGEGKLLFESNYNSTPKLGEKWNLSISETDKNRFLVYSQDYKGNDKTLFLSEMNRNKSYSHSSKLKIFKEVYSWITNNIIILSPNLNINNFEYYYDVDSLEKINQLLKSLDTGISEVMIKKIDLEELENLLPKEIFDDVLLTIRSQIQKNEKFVITLRREDSFFNIILNENNEIDVSTICTKHGESKYDFNFEEESDGTRRIFGLMDLLLSKKDDVIYMIDELERSLHPKLTQCFLELFMKIHKNNKVQLLLATHENSIMDLDIFRRDEIWFIEKDSNNASNMYSLDKFKERYDKKLSKAYLEGRYGAIPVFSNFLVQEE